MLGRYLRHNLQEYHERLWRNSPVLQVPNTIEYGICRCGHRQRQHNRHLYGRCGNAPM